MKLHHILTIPLCTAFAAMTTFAADTKSSLENADENFIKKAAVMGKAEVQVSELGAQKASSPEVKEIAAKMIADHTKTNQELTAFAESKGVELTAAKDPDAQEVIASLEKESGADFDKAFLKQLKKDHEKTIDLFEEASKDSKNAELKAWVDKTLPTLRAHLEHVDKALEAK